MCELMTSDFLLAYLTSSNLQFDGGGSSIYLFLSLVN